MSEEVLQVISVMFALAFLGIGCIAFSFWFIWENGKRNQLQGITDGQGTGLVKSTL